MFFAKKRKELEKRLEELAAELSLTKKELAEAHRALDYLSLIHI